MAAFRGVRESWGILFGGNPGCLSCWGLLHLGGSGLWIGLNAGSVVQSVLLCLVTSFANWEKQVLSPLTPALMYSFSCIINDVNSATTLHYFLVENAGHCSS